MNKLPDWFCRATGCVQDGNTMRAPGGEYTLRDYVWVANGKNVSCEQKQTEGVFAHKWKKEDTFTSEETLARVRQWAFDRYGDFAPILNKLGERPVVLAAMTALEYFGPYFDKIHYTGVDVSEAVFVAQKRVTQRGFSGVFLQDDLVTLPFAHGGLDCIFSEGVLHHTDSTKGALASLTPLLRPGGYFLFYVYNKKGPIREFTDDCIREKLQAMSPEDAWEALRPLTDLGIQLGDLNAEINLPEGVPILDIPAGKISLQRFFYWHIFKAFYDPATTFEEMHHINFDWYAPKNAHRQTPQEVQQWCDEFGLHIERLQVEKAGITVVARKE